MSIFSSILSKIFPASHPAVAASQGAPSTSTPAGAAPSAQAAASAAPPAAPAAPAPMAEVDVEAVLSSMAEKNPEKLNWRTSIVDLLKLLGLDSSITARKQLAGELHYEGDTNDSATMNMWLQKQVMTKLEQNGGKVPADMK